MPLFYLTMHSSSMTASCCRCFLVGLQSPGVVYRRMRSRSPTFFSSEIDIRLVDILISRCCISGMIFTSFSQSYLRFLCALNSDAYVLSCCFTLPRRRDGSMVDTAPYKAGTSPTHNYCP